MKVPVILREQEIIVQWARKMKLKYTNFNTIVKLLSDSKESKRLKGDEDYLKAREIYNRFNNGWRDEVLKAVMMECYMLENDFKENDIVTNGILIGFAKELDYGKRRFLLCASIDGNPLCNLGIHQINDFSKIARI